ncbi:MAG TPA: hypothetical protein VKU39_00600 [Streptosporangiaceae bacterium]|nr:hypothetical protein [Streptosporangiaceae bacterium]
MESTWERRELPVLRALVEHFDDVDADRLQPAQIAQLAAVGEDQVKRALKALYEAEPPFIRGTTIDQAPYPVWINGVTERGRRAAGVWPDPGQLADRLLAALEKAADAEPEGEKRSALKRTLAFLGGTGREILVQTTATVLGGQLGH